ncbi:MAG: FtsX-like permease family protein [Planctomycetota bacterium]
MTQRAHAPALIQANPSTQDAVYQALLTRRYLTTKVMPLLAAVAVALCTAMVLITWSVMGGFLKTLVDSGRTLIGDVSIHWPNVGFAHYDELIDRLEADPDIEAAAPMIQTLGVIPFPDGKAQDVLLKGIEGDSFDRVTGFADSIYWRPIDTPLPKDTDNSDRRLRNHDFYTALFNNGAALTKPDPETGTLKPALVLGAAVTGYNIRDADGVLTPGVPYSAEADGSVTAHKVFLPLDGELTLHVLPLSDSGRGVEVVSRVLPVANEFRSNIYDIDRRTVFVRLDALQSMLNMDEAQRLADEAAAPDPFAETEEGFAAPPGLVVDPPRVTTVLVRGRAGLDAREVKAACERVYAGFAQDHAGRVPPALEILMSTWEEQNATLIAAVRKETGLVLFIFSFISLTAVFLVLAIFWSMVSEKTKDVGVLRALGASSWGVAGVWLAYGLAIGLVGSIAGGVIALLVVRNINQIHEWIGQLTGQYIWDPAVYYFTEIPSEVDPAAAGFVLLGGVLSCFLGAAWPAIRAARMRPVRALRFE